MSVTYKQATNLKPGDILNHPRFVSIKVGYVEVESDRDVWIGGKYIERGWPGRWHQSDLRGYTVSKEN